MSGRSHTFTTSPGAVGEQRKFINPTPGWIGANKFGPDGKPTAIGVEPGGEVWLTPEEERMTAEAPRFAEHNPFVMAWEEPVDWDSNGEVTRTVHREGTLVLADEPPRPVASDRFIPERPASEPSMQNGANSEPVVHPPAEEETVTGAPPLPEQPPVEGQPSPDEVVGTPEAVTANDEALAEREPTVEQPTKAQVKEGPIPV